MTSTVPPGRRLSASPSRHFVLATINLSRESKRCWPWQDYILAFQVRTYCLYVLIVGVQSKLRSIVLLGPAIFLITPGTSCLATITLSLWDKDILPAGALIELAYGSVLGRFVMMLLLCCLNRLPATEFDRIILYF
jgi:hypothetical protein